MSHLPSHLKYAESHEWAKLEDSGIVRVGITDFAQAQLGDVVFIDLPDAGKVVKAAAPVAVIESVKAASDIHSPVSGEIVEVNPLLTSAPESVNQDAYAAWLFSVRPSNPAELDALMSADAYLASVT
jgi:glycine cleavage system H protein